MTRMSTMMIATTSRMWMNPPTVEEETIPRAHRTRRIRAIVQSMAFPFFHPFWFGPGIPARRGTESRRSRTGVSAEEVDDLLHALDRLDLADRRPGRLGAVQLAAQADHAVDG